MTAEQIKNAITSIIAPEYPIKRAILFGSRADGTNCENSDVDLIMEFYEPVSLLKLSEIRCRLEDILQLNVDIIHGPVQEQDLIEVHKALELYAA